MKITPWIVLAAVLFAGCKKDNGTSDEADTDTDTDSDTDTDTDADTDSDTDADTDTDTDSDTDTDTGLPLQPGEGSMTLTLFQESFLLGPQQMQMLGLFVDDRQGIGNVAECYPQLFNFCLDTFPAVEDTFVDHTTAFDPTQAVFLDVGPEIGLDVYNAQRFFDPTFGTFYLEALIPDFAGGQPWAAFFSGGAWGNYVGQDDIVTPTPIEVLAPNPLVESVRVVDTVNFQWVPTGDGIVTLLVSAGGTGGAVVARTYLLEDDGSFQLDVDSLGLTDANDELTFILARSTYVDIDVNGNPLHLGVRSEAWIRGTHPPVGDREPLDLGDDCATAPLIEEGSFWGEISGVTNDYDPGNGGCTGDNAFGSEVVGRVQVGPGERVQIDGSLFGNDVALYLLEDCADLSTCVAGSDYSFDAAERLLYTNDGDATVSLNVVVDSPDFFSTDLFFLDVAFDVPGVPTEDMYDTCIDARNNHVLPPGTHTIDLRDQTDDLDPGALGCALTDSPGPDMIAAVDVPDGEVLRVDANAPVAMYMLTDCIDETTCVSGSPVYGSLEFLNSTGADQVGFLVIDDPGEPGVQGPFEITVSTVAIETMVPGETCADLPNAPVYTTGLHLLEGDITGYPSNMDLAVPGPSCTTFESAGAEGVATVRLQPGETVTAEYAQTASSGDGVLYLLETCGDTLSTVACDDGIPPVDETISFTNTSSTPAEYVLVLDNYGLGGGVEGPFTLRLQIQ